MKLVKSVLWVLSFFLVLGCNNNSEDTGIDCTASDLSISVVSSTKSDCDVPGSIVVKADGGEEPYSFSLNELDFQGSESFDNLFAGNFNITVKDNLGCTAEVKFTLESEPTGITLDLTSTNTPCGSSEGSIEAEANGGTGVLLFALGGGQFSEINIFSGLSQGEYQVTVKDEESCEVTKTIQVLTNTSLAADIMPIIQKDCAISGCHNGSQSPRLTTNQEVIENAARIKSETQAGSMPRNRTLSDQEIALIACWVDDGALNN
ncbi:hypothetical protein [Ekhidna sp.]|uniref:hypothetical protein n=1 Tax=Ekhidna sp. TaxID=2608089 RepID=UPI003B5CC6E2